MSFVWRGLFALGAAVGTGTVVVIILALIDIYLAGHGKPSFVHKPIGLAGSRFSWGDAILLASAGLAGLLAWFALKPQV